MSTTAEAQTLTLRDGRRLGCVEYGDPGGEPGFYFHGHPGSRLEARFADEAAAWAGVRIIALDRPGYGLSDFQPRRTIVDWPRDVAEAADLLGLDRFAVLGASGGGPYALACAHEIPQRITRTGVVSGVGPYDAPGATQGMRWQNRVGFQLGARFPALARLIMWSMAQAMSPADAEVARRPEVRQILAADIAESFRQGGRGAALDSCCWEGRGASASTRSRRRYCSSKEKPTPSCRRRWGGTWPRRSPTAARRSSRARAICSLSVTWPKSSRRSWRRSSSENRFRGHPHGGHRAPDVKLTLAGGNVICCRAVAAIPADRP